MSQAVTQQPAIEAGGSNKIIIVSTRAPENDPKKPISGGMAPAVRDASVFFDSATWFGVKKKGGVILNGDLGMEFEGAVDVSEIEEFQKEGIDIVLITADEYEFEGHYNEFSNGILWPLFHDRTDLTKAADIMDYSGSAIVNNRLARQIKQQLDQDQDASTPIWVHDYHHFNLPPILRAMGVQNPIIFFNHTPLPDPDSLNEIDETSRVLFQNYIKGFAKTVDAAIFQSDETADRFLQIAGIANKDEVPELQAYTATQYEFGDHNLTVGNFPISINVDEISAYANLGGLTDPNGHAQGLQDQLVADYVFMDFCRADYSKGMTERLKAFGQLLEERPELKGKAQMVIGAEPTRTDIQSYIDYSDAVKSLAEGLNAQEDLYVDGQPPIVYLPKRIPRADVVQLFRNDKPDQRKIATITAWRDGMNLVCKEAMLAQDPDNAGVLVLSNGAGAAREHGFAENAVLYTPDLNDQRELVDALYEAVNMPQEEANRRAQAAQEHLRMYSLEQWSLAHVQLINMIPGHASAAHFEKDEMQITKLQASVGDAQAQRMVIPKQENGRVIFNFGPNQIGKAVQADVEFETGQINYEV